MFSLNRLTRPNSSLHQFRVDSQSLPSNSCRHTQLWWRWRREVVHSRHTSFSFVICLGVKGLFKFDKILKEFGVSLCFLVYSHLWWHFEIVRFAVGVYIIRLVCVLLLRFRIVIYQILLMWALFHLDELDFQVIWYLNSWCIFAFSCLVCVISRISNSIVYLYCLMWCLFHKHCNLCWIF